jgi:hypothetical protein
MSSFLQLAADAQLDRETGHTAILNEVTVSWSVGYDDAKRVNMLYR